MINRALMSTVSRHIFGRPTQTPALSRSCDVFINHRGIDTRHNVAGLLYDSLSRFNVQAFLDRESLKPGNKLFEEINTGIRECKVAVTLISPNYCDSYSCLHELVLIMESKKKVIPIFCDIKPSDLKVCDIVGCSKNDISRFRMALEEARYTVGITFDSQTGNWAELVRRATDTVLNSLVEIEEKKNMNMKRNMVARKSWLFIQPSKLQRSK